MTGAARATFFFGGMLFFAGFADWFQIPTVAFLFLLAGYTLMLTVIVCVVKP